MRTAVTCLACVLFAGCAHSSGVLNMGPDTYTVSAAAAPARGGSSEARKIALTAANDHCAQMGKEILVTNVGTATTNIYGAGSAEVTFRCLAKAVATTSVPAYAGLTGTYKGEITGTARGQATSMRVTFTLVQNGDDVVGVWNTTGGTSGTVSGTVQEGRISAFRAKQVNPCEGDLTGAAVIEDSGARLRGSYTGDDCSGHVTASFVVSRQ